MCLTTDSVVRLKTSEHISSLTKTFLWNLEVQLALESALIPLFMHLTCKKTKILEIGNNITKTQKYHMK